MKQITLTILTILTLVNVSLMYTSNWLQKQDNPKYRKLKKIVKISRHIVVPAVVVLLCITIYFLITD